MKKDLNRFIILLFFLFGTQLDSKAQNNQIEAKASYLIAEEKFAEGDYESTLKYLDRATKSLGGSNSKLLYLQIQAEFELYKKDKTYYDQIVKSIAAFQNAPDANSFAEDKVIEVAKVKIQLAKEQDKVLEQHKIDEAEKESHAATFRDFSFENWPIGIPFNELKASHQDSAFFQGETHMIDYVIVNGQKVKSDLVMNVRNDFFENKGTVSCIITKGDVVKGYQKLIYKIERVQNMDATAGKSYADGKKDIAKLVEHISAEFGFDPVVEEHIYRWQKNNKKVMLHDRSHYVSDTLFGCRAVLEISEP